jgi:ABC-type sugar transport system ATPase subunit
LENDLPSLPVVRLSSIRKAFGPTVAVDGVDLEIFPGEVLCLVGENGAGKSTLMKILGGLYPGYDGRIEVAGRPARIANVRQAKRMGISLVHQELSLVPELSVAENIFLGQEPMTAIPGFISRQKTREQAAALLHDIGVSIEPTKKISGLSGANRQLVEIAKGLAGNPKGLILDEPTSSLTEIEARDLFAVIRRCTQKNMAVVYISHKLEEIFALATRITVMRDGAKVSEGPASEWDEAKLIKAMVGREFSSLFPHNHTPDPVMTAMEVNGLTRGGVFKDISFQLHQGEVLGIYGLIGAGRSEVAEALCGLTPAENGTIQLFGEPVKIKNPWTAKSRGISMVPEDRRKRGLVLMHSVGNNLSLPVLKSLSRVGFVKNAAEKKEVIDKIREFSIQAASPDIAAETLSGGNQQKVVIGKWLMRPPRILILDEPTRGIDVGAKAEIHALIDKLAAQGMAILLISSELPEIMGMSDRVLVMCEGEIAGEFSRAGANAENLGRAAAGAGREGKTAGGAE